ncbi:hypothetical protein PC129_g6296 [Phytophthora cactorum]|uniref:Uncharacterized protein n=1 Tax=Phytophthora cactorum TaxID=29920 RepID=A0A8T1L0Z1_9STRA|nr:hypothetical protein PC114_g8933 [Phytophthora cactorum]KAG2945115.1 hypothetical protein PC117_g8719 [Phytophthora cactorum]KAG3023924.1 hypothetical protein PC120_g7296 [Phytophthora cactorum]KAG3024664.1 hypothetical protein PC119_g8391 [Phytophthora cactorum]KAG3175557.1 hypothetical protein C6341_g9417 [Phytophthora cactorum]
MKPARRRHQWLGMDAIFHTQVRRGPVATPASSSNSTELRSSQPGAPPRLLGSKSATPGLSDRPRDRRIAGRLAPMPTK